MRKKNIATIIMHEMAAILAIQFAPRRKILPLKKKKLKF
jgi:hypothetical protein